ncbi:MAG TPA: hypothetical protein VH372_03850 [Actinospica sp.]|jgi:hypothetical protein|nr:hypothetical protein [Actinospica sp.]
MPSVPDLTPEEIAAVLEARRARTGVEDALPPSLTARLDREVAARVDAELASRGARMPSSAAMPVQPARRQEKSDGRVVGIVSLVAGIPLMGIVEGTSHGNLGGAAIVMAGLVLVNMAHALGRRRHQ